MLRIGFLCENVLVTAKPKYLAHKSGCYFTTVFSENVVLRTVMAHRQKDKFIFAVLERTNSGIPSSSPQCRNDLCTNFPVLFCTVDSSRPSCLLSVESSVLFQLKYYKHCIRLCSRRTNDKIQL